MNPMLQQFMAVALPIIVTFVGTIWASSWSQNKRLDEMSRRFDDRIDAIGKRFDDMGKRFEDRFDGMNRRIDEIIVRLDRIEAKLDNHGERIARLEGQASRVTR